MLDDIEVYDAATLVRQYDKDIEDAEGDRGTGEEFDGSKLVGRVLQEGSPGLRRRFGLSQHVFGDSGLRDLDGGLQQFPVYSRLSMAN